MLRVELCYSEIFNHPPTLIINPPRQLYKKHRPSAKDRSHTDRFLCSRWSTVLQFRDCAIVFYLQRTSLSKLCFSICYHVVASQSWSRYRTYESTCRLNILRLIFPQKEPVADTRRCCPVNQTLPRGFIPPPSPPSRANISALMSSTVSTTNRLLSLFVPFSTLHRPDAVCCKPTPSLMLNLTVSICRPHVIRPVLKRLYLSNHMWFRPTFQKGRFKTRRWPWHWVAILSMDIEWKGKTLLSLSTGLGEKKGM